MTDITVENSVIKVHETAVLPGFPNLKKQLYFKFHYQSSASDWKTKKGFISGSIF